MLEIQRYLMDFGVEKATQEPLNLVINEYPEHGVMTLNYSQINSPKHNTITRECRGLILENIPPFKIISRSFDRFLNYGECPNSETWPGRITNDSVRVIEKLDGSIMPLSFFNGKWTPSTRKCVFAEGNTAWDISFKQLFDSIINYDLVEEHVDKSVVLIFEMVSPESRVVKPYSHRDLYLIGARNKVTGKEYNWEALESFAFDLNVKMPESYQLNSIDRIVESLKELDAFDEGYVVCDYSTFERIKIKNPSYLAISHLRNNGIISPKRITTLVFENETDEYLQYFPEDKDIFKPYVYAYDKLLFKIAAVWENSYDLTNQKDFAMAVKDFPFSGVMFMMRKGIAMGKCLEGLTDNSKLELLENYM